MKTTGLRILQVTDSASDAVSISRVLETACYEVHSENLATSEQLQNALASAPWQLVIVHNQSSALSPNRVLDILRQVAPELPCIVISDKLGKEAVELLKAGACDFILKEDLSRLGVAVRSALQIPQQRAVERYAEKALRESEEKFSSMIRISPDPIVLSRLKDGRYIDVNDAFTRILGYTKDEVYGRSSMPGDLNVWVDQVDRERFATELRAKGEISGFEAPFRVKSGQIITGLVSGGIVQINGEKCIVTFTRDISKRKQAEVEREATIRLLRLCNQHDNTRELVRALTQFFQELSGCEAIGIRLRDGPDFPYFETRGFSQEFVLAETRLCARDAAGMLLRDEAGNPVLDCMCGNILCGRHDPTKAFFTQNGSFWSTGTTELLASTSEADRQARTRNRCNGEGYESVALIPLRHQTSTLGLLQLNDRRKGMLTVEKITFFEGLAEYISIALMKLESDRALRSTEDHLRVVLETSEAGYFFIDPAGLFQRVNAAWLRLHGYERAEEILGKHFSHTQAEPDQKKAAEVVAQLLAGAKIAAGEFSRRRRDGSIGYHTFSAHAVREEGRIIGAEGFLIDTTGLRKIRDEYQMLFDQMLDGFALHEMIFDPAGAPVDYRFLAVNPAFERMTGLNAAAVIGKNVLTVLPETERKWIELYGEVVSTGEPKRFEDFSKVLGKHFEVLAFRPRQGQFACVIQDVTNRKQLEMQLLQAQKMEAIGQLAGGVAHDFNNILAATMMHLSLLQRVPELTLTMRNSLKELESETKRATSLTRQLLLFSRRQVLCIDTIDLNELLGNLLRMLRRLIGEHINLVFNPGVAPLWIEADAGMVEQVVMNLCVNARDAMPEGGRIIIGADSLRLASTLTLGDTEPRSGDFVCLSISDTGCGMDAATQKHIFEPFFTTKEAGKGTGLGLATVYSIVKQHRGWINVHSSVGKGSAFRIFLPSKCNPPPMTNKSREASPIKGGAEGVLVVEDDAAFRNMMVMTLQVLGYRVFEANDGRAALSLWEKHAAEISFLFTDQIMPGGISGLDLCRRLHADKPTLRRMISTGYTTNVIDPAVLAAEGIDFLPKPFTSESLAHAVRRCIDRTEGVSLNS